jgi:hypothetical protein
MFKLLSILETFQLNYSKNQITINDIVCDVLIKETISKPNWNYHLCNLQTGDVSICLYFALFYSSAIVYKLKLDLNTLNGFTDTYYINKIRIIYLFSDQICLGQSEIVLFLRFMLRKTDADFTRCFRWRSIIWQFLYWVADKDLSSASKTLLKGNFIIWLKMICYCSLQQPGWWWWPCCFTQSVVSSEHRVETSKFERPTTNPEN